MRSPVVRNLAITQGTRIAHAVAAKRRCFRSARVVREHLRVADAVERIRRMMVEPAPGRPDCHDRMPRAFRIITSPAIAPAPKPGTAMARRTRKQALLAARPDGLVARANP